MAATALARVSTTVLPLTAGAVVVLSPTGPSVPPWGVFFTENEVLARFGAAPSVSLKTIVSLSPITDAEATSGGSSSTTTEP